MAKSNAFLEAVKNSGPNGGSFDFSMMGAADNPSGIEPTGFRVLVRPIEIPEKASSIIKPDEYREKEKFAQQEGILIAVSPAAFNYDDAIRDKAPQPGARVLYAKYAGFIHKGNDGLEYRIIEDKDVAAVLT